VWYPESVGLLSSMAVVSDQRKTVVSGNAIGYLCRYDSSLGTNFNVISTVVSIKLDTQANRMIHAANLHITGTHKT